MARRFKEDFGLWKELGVGREFFEEWESELYGGSWRKLISDQEFGDEVFAKLDGKELRACCLRRLTGGLGEKGRPSGRPQQGKSCAWHVAVGGGQRRGAGGDGSGGKAGKVLSAGLHEGGVVLPDVSLPQGGDRQHGAGRGLLEAGPSAQGSNGTWP